MFGNYHNDGNLAQDDDGSLTQDDPKMMTRWTKFPKQPGQIQAIQMIITVGIKKRAIEYEHNFSTWCPR